MPIPGGDERILFVDDEDAIVNLGKKGLERLGYEVMEAPDGKVALWLYKEKPADLIITDIIMPEKEGIETITDFKREFADVRIIAISGGGQGDKRQSLDMARKVGADSTLAKPFEREELLNEVTALLP